MNDVTTLQLSTSWDSFNAFLLHGSTDRFTKILSRYELFKRVIEIPGDIVEGGVFKGAGVLYWAKLIQIFNPLSLRKVVGFDTFGSFPGESEADRKFADAFCAEAHYEGVDPSALMGIAGECAIERRMELIAGDASVTMADYAARNPGFRIALLNLDFDTYAPTHAALEALYDRVVPGGIIIFDEYGLPDSTEADAVDEFLARRAMPGMRLQSLSWNLSPMAFMVKP